MIIFDNIDNRVGFLKPPTSEKGKLGYIFSEHFVRMHGQDYYLRLFKDGSVEFTRFDADTMKWVFLVFSKI